MRREDRDGTEWEELRHEFYDVVMSYRKDNKNLSERLTENPPVIHSKDKYGYLDIIPRSDYDNTIEEWCMYVERLASMRTDSAQ